MATKYPSSIDDNLSLPLARDSVTGINASSVNILQGASIAIETALGQKPQGMFATVKARLDALESLIQSAIIGEISFSGDISGTVTHQTVIGLQNYPISATAPQLGQPLIYDGAQYTPSTNFQNQNIMTSGVLISGPALSTSSETGLFTLDGKFIINGITTSAPSNPGQAIIYYDSVGNKVKVSENGGAYVNLLTADAISWTQDLLGSTISNQIVVGLTGIAGATTIRDTSPTLQWVAGATNPTITQADSATDGYDMFITAQNAGGSNKVGGSLVLSGGVHSGSAADGYVSLRNGGTEVARTASAQLNATIYGVGAISGAVPTITSGIGAPASTPQNGSIYLRQDGYFFTGLYLYEQNSWFPVGSDNVNITTITTDYLVSDSDSIIAVGSISTSITITLPAVPLQGQQFIIKDENGNAATYNIIINGNGKNIDGISTLTIDQNYASITLIYFGTSWGVI